MAKFNPLYATANELQRLLAEGKLSSVDIIKTYLNQVRAFNPRLRAVIQTAPESLLICRAEALDSERQENNIRGPLHGIPILIKDNIDTHPSLGMGTTGGSFALLHAKPKANAVLIEQLQDAGAIVLGKANLSEFAWFMGKRVPCGWSAVGGQTQSAYVEKGFHPSEPFGSHNNTGGSSSGSAVAVSAGFAPLSIGTETCGSLIMPANRAGLYTMKPTIGLISQKGIIPASDLCDSAGPMTKSARDLTDLLEALVDKSQSQHVSEGSYSKALSLGWKGLKIGYLDPEEWRPSESISGRDDDFKLRDIERAWSIIEDNGAESVGKVSLISIDKLTTEGGEDLDDVWKGNLDRLITSYLTSLETSAVRSLKDIVAFNKSYDSIELPPGINQEYFVNSLKAPWSEEKTKSIFTQLRKIARLEGVDATLEKHGIDVILGPGDADALECIIAATGYPAITLPLSTYTKNGRPLGMMAIAGQYQEAKLIQLAGAWEPLFSRPIPSNL